MVQVAQGPRKETILLAPETSPQVLLELLRTPVSEHPGSGARVEARATGVLILLCAAHRHLAHRGLGDRAWSLIHVFIIFLRSHSRHMEVPRLEVKLELQLQDYTTATATWHPN